MTLRLLATMVLVLGLLPGVAAMALGQAVSTASIAGSVRDESGAVLPGVTVTATQTATGLVRTAVTDETGGYTLPSLPVGPYRVEFSLSGFRSYVQSGITLQVNSNPTVNATMALGQLSETVQVEAAAPLIETRNPGIGQVVDNQRVVELPLNGRQTLDLVFLTGLATPGGNLGGARGSTFGAPTTIAVAGGLANGATYILDGGTHNDPFSNAAMPFPFPEALQEFKVETSALPAQYGQHSSSAINAVTKSGTNSTTGNLFEFFRDASMNATNPFAALGPDGKRRDDGLNRHQFGGTLGGAVVSDRLFYFGGYQRTRIRRVIPTAFQFGPTPAMLAGDFTAIASAACNAGRAVPLRAPFVNNRIDPALLSPASVRLARLLPTPANDCGQVFFDRIDDADQHIFVGRLDYSMSNNHTIFGRYQHERLDTPGDYDGVALMSSSNASFVNRTYSFVAGDTLVIGSNIVNSVRATVNRGNYRKTAADLVDYGDVGIRATPLVPGVLRMAVTGGFSLQGGPALPGETPTWTYQFTDDFSVIRGQHQFGLGVNFIRSTFTSVSYLAASGNVSFTGQNTGLGLADFMVGRPVSFSQGTLTGLDLANNYIGVYAQDSWRVSPNITVNAGLRWEPFMPVSSRNDRIAHFDRGRFNRGIRSTVFPTAPAGLMFTGDDGMPGQQIARNQFKNFAPRAGVVWDPQGEGRQTLRASYGRFYDMPHLQSFVALSQMAPWGNTITITNLPLGWDDPYAAYPGGNPIPITPSPTMAFPQTAAYTTFPLDLPATNMDQWNVSYQHQLGDRWMVSANYLGNRTNHLWGANQINPAVFGPGATAANTNQRRVLSLANPAEGAYYASIQELDTSGTGQYNALLLSAQSRSAAGLSVQGNYTLSRCTSDLTNYEPGVAGPPYMIPGNREADRGRCALSADHIVNVSAVYTVPAAGDSGIVKAITGGWQLSGIVTARSGSYFTVTTGVDNALTGQPGQRANQVLDDPFMANRTLSRWLNPAAFAAPAAGSYGTMAIDALQGPGRWNVDTGLTRSFGVGTGQVQFRLEVFNLFNHVNPSNPISVLSSPTFGQVTSTATDQRIMQLALKYLF
jgi:hypothetical protein